VHAFILQGIVHADLKPENLMFSAPSPASTLKVRSGTGVHCWASNAAATQQCQY
jgi:hypothetical protein